MPSSDIAKCPGKNCTIRDTCRRFTLPSSGERQVWIETPKHIASGAHPGLCPEYWRDSREA